MKFLLVLSIIAAVAVLSHQQEVSVDASTPLPPSVEGKPQELPEGVGFPFIPFILRRLFSSNAVNGLPEDGDTPLAYASDLPANDEGLEKIPAKFRIILKF